MFSFLSALIAFLLIYEWASAQDVLFWKIDRILLCLTSCPAQSALFSLTQLLSKTDQVSIFSGVEQRTASGTLLKRASASRGIRATVSDSQRLHKDLLKNWNTT